jgi:hypothetical protein
MGTPHLPSDILDRVLSFISDFKTLQTVLITSRALYDVFQAHPHSIVRAVAHNVVGPALPQALRVIRCDGNTLDVVLEDNVLSQAITPGEAQLLSQFSTTVNDLENIFSLRYHSFLFFVEMA